MAQDFLIPNILFTLLKKQEEGEMGKSAVYVHTYVKGAGGNVIFYRFEDFLTFITILYITARRDNVTIISLCIMMNHIHLLERADDMATVSRFQMNLERQFAKEYNNEYARSGPLFKCPFGKAEKATAKKLRTCAAYINNNPVAGRLTKRSIEYRWNLIAYHDNKYPFSCRVPLAKCSMRYRRAVSLVKWAFESGKAIAYPLLRTVLSELNKEERRRISDYIISEYNPLAYDELARLYGSIESAVAAFDLNTGSEYGIVEDWEDYSLYRSALVEAIPFGIPAQGCSMDNIDIDLLRELYQRIMAIPNMSYRIARKFLHLKETKHHK